MEDTSQIAEVIGMDAHSRKISLCHMRREGDAIVKVRTLSTTLDALEKTYTRQLPPGVPTVLEASTNSFSIAKRLGAIGREALVLCADVLSGLSRQDRVNDRIDAENLARARLRYGAELRTVYVPSPHGIDLRETWFAYRDAKKDQTRAANRIWSFCSRHGLDVDQRVTESRCRSLLDGAAERGWSESLSDRARGLVEKWRHAAETCEARLRAIDKGVFGDWEMTRLQQVPGIRSVGAFAIVSCVGDVRRFENPKKLVSYVGLNPSVCESGEKEGRRKVSKFGRSDLKMIFVEAAQCTLRNDSDMSRWARHLIAKGKPKNVAVCALARKIVVLCWHILMGHPAPGLEGRKAAESKLARLASRAGKDAVKAAGYRSRSEYVADVSSRIYGHLTGTTAEVAKSTVSP